MSAEDTSCPLGRVTVLGAHILDVLGMPVEAIPPGQGSARLQEIRATAAGTAAGAGVDTSGLSRKSGPRHRRRSSRSGSPVRAATGAPRPQTDRARADVINGLPPRAAGRAAR